MSLSNNSTMKKHDVSAIAELGVGLGYRVKRSLSPYLTNFSIAGGNNKANVIGTTQITVGMPNSSVQDAVHYAQNAEILNIASTSILDADGSTGATHLFIRGLSADFQAVISEVVVLNGRTPVSTVNAYLRVNKMVIDGIGALGKNQGDIYVSDSTDTFTLGIPQNRVWRAMLAGENVDTFGSYSIQAGHRLHLVRGNYYFSATQTKPLLLREDFFLSNSRGQRQFYSSGSIVFTGQRSFSFEGAAPSNEKTDFNWSAESTAGGSNTVYGVVYYEAALEQVNKNPWRANTEIFLSQ